MNLLTSREENILRLQGKVATLHNVRGGCRSHHSLYKYARGVVHCTACVARLGQIWFRVLNSEQCLG